MDPTTLRAALRRTPFCPFRLVTDDGSSHEVRARDQAVLTSTEIAIAQEWPGEDLPRCILTVTLSTIARIEWLGAEGPEEDPPACIHGTEKNTMEIEGLRTALRRAPFRPFRMFLSDGSHHDVMHQELMVLERRQVALWHGFDRRGFVRDLVLIDALHITRVEPLPDDDSGSKQAG